MALEIALPDVGLLEEARGERAVVARRERVVGFPAGIAIPHMIQDDGRLLSTYVRRVKHTKPQPGLLMLAVDQSFHVVVLFGLALAAGG